MKEEILKVVNRRTAIRAVDLVLDVMAIVNPQTFNHFKYSNDLKELIMDREIVILQYTDPSTPHAIQSIFFRKGTQFEPS